MTTEYVCSHCPFGLVRFVTMGNAYCTTPEDAKNIRQKMENHQTNVTHEAPVAKCDNPNGTKS